MARAATTSDVFNAIAEPRRRQIVDYLALGTEHDVTDLVVKLRLPQPAVSKHLRVLSEAGLVSCRAQGRRRVYQLDPTHLRPLRQWLVKYERVMTERLNQMDDYLTELQAQGE